MLLSKTVKWQIIKKKLENMDILPNINKGMKKLNLLNSHFKSNILEIKIYY